MSVESLIATTSQMAAILGVTERRIQQLRTLGMPRERQGKWDVTVAIPWYIEQREKSERPHDKTSEEAQRRYYLARAGLTEHKEAEAKGQAVSLAEHKAVVSELTADIAGTIEAFPVREYTDPSERAYAERICFRIRECLAVAVAPKRMAGRKGNGVAHPGASAQEEREPVGGAPPDAATA